LNNEVEHHAEEDLLRRVDEALESIRPYLAADGGSVKLLDVTQDMVVELELLGACGECPISEMTLRAGIEQAIKRAVPDVVRVEAVKRS
jgi:Fe-S cluster biogenesis protein NfuA